MVPVGIGRKLVIFRENLKSGFLFKSNKIYFIENLEKEMGEDIFGKQ
jgi:hypothetical protein